MEIVPYERASHAGAVERLNRRLADAGVAFQFPLDDAPAAAGLPVREERFVALEGGDAYGGYRLKHQRFFCGGREIELGNIQLPLSMGAVDPGYARIAAALLFDALERSPSLYCLGMGSEENKIARIFQAAGWQHRPVPFFFSVKSPNRFAREVRLPANQAACQTALRVAGKLRLAGVLFALHRVCRRHQQERAGSGIRSAAPRVIPRFSESADRLFERESAGHFLVGERTAGVLNGLYQEGNPRFIRLSISSEGREAGWAVVLDTTMRGHKYFGDLRVGSLADGFAAPVDAGIVVRAADEFLTARGVDLVVSNQMHPAWGRALKAAGYVEGPSNFFFYYSPAFTGKMAERAGWEQGVHLNRGDGDGPIHL